ncbi:MAG: hypothetical protein ACU0AZ_15955 [Paracoccaceae bacterium]
MLRSKDVFNLWVTRLAHDFAAHPVGVFERTGLEFRGSDPT